MKYKAGEILVLGLRRPPRGGRGLKYDVPETARWIITSPPSRGAWIEIREKTATALYRLGRPPRGGRGLKLYAPAQRLRDLMVAPLAGGVD